MTLMVGWHENLSCGSKVGGVDWVCFAHDRNEWGCPADGLITLSGYIKGGIFFTIGLALHSEEGELLWSLIVSSDFGSFNEVHLYKATVISCTKCSVLVTSLSCRVVYFISYTVQ
jgi:hypothetical protein